MSYNDAVASGAVAIFDEKYGDEVRVVAFGDASVELCGGTHAGATGEIGLLKVLGETGVAAGVRRIEALTGFGALAHVRATEERERRAAELLKAPVAELPERVEKLLAEKRELERELEKLRAEKRGSSAGDLLAGAVEIEGGKALAARVEGIEAKDLSAMVDDLRNRLGSSVVALLSDNGGKVLVAVGVTRDLIGPLKAGDIVRELAGIVGGGGGGRPDFAQAGGKDASKIDDALARFSEIVGAR
jgi:alanyl-tRNA synthetase